MLLPVSVSHDVASNKYYPAGAGFSGPGLETNADISLSWGFGYEKDFLGGPGLSRERRVESIGLSHKHEAKSLILVPAIA